MKILETKRLILRLFKTEDLEEMTLINQDPKVCKYLASIGNRDTTGSLIQRILTHYQQYGFSLYAVIHQSTGKLIGFTGLISPVFEAHFTPAIEIGWRLSSDYWNQGYATEAAKAVLEHAFVNLNLKDLVSFTVPANKASRRVMEKIGMRHNPLDDFEHPQLSPAHPLRQQVLYRLSQADYLANR